MDLKVDVIVRNMEATDRLNDYAVRKVSKLDRFLGDIDEARVDLSHVKSARNAADRHVAQVTLRGKRFILRTDQRAEDIFAAIDAAVDKMQRQNERLKGKRQRGRGDRTPASEVAPAKVEDEIEVPVIARRKKFLLSPMDELEALEQMTLVGHENFFIFFNVNTNAINVLYRRRDGSYGLIEPYIG